MANNNHLSEVDGGPLPKNTITTSVFSNIEQGLRKNPHKAAIICMHQPANHLSGLAPVDNVLQQENGGHSMDCLTLTYTQIHRAALTLAAGLIANGVQPDSTIVTLIPNGGEYGILFWTCTIMRLTFAAWDPSALESTGDSQLRNLMAAVKPGLVVVPNAAGARVVDDLIQDLGPEQPLRIVLDGTASNGWKSLPDLVADASNSPINEHSLLENARRDDADRIHSILFTSGTSVGQPKGCPQRVGSITHILTSQSWLINPENCNLVLQQAHNSRAIAPQHTLQAWRGGGTVVMARKSFAIEDTVKAIVKYGVDFIVLSPAMVHELARELEAHPGKLDSVRTIQIGGDAITKEILTKCASLFSQAKVCINHGMTEGGAFFTWPFFATPLLQIPFFGDEICPIGTVAAGTMLRIWNADKRYPKTRGEPGELHVYSESIIRSYLGCVSESSFYEDGTRRWFITGDVGLIDEEGLVFILGRSKDVIRRAGAIIMPARLESCIEKYTGAQVSIACVFFASVRPY